MRWFPIPAFVASAALLLAAPAGAAGLAGVPKLPPGWSHAEINVIVKRQPHTLIYDRGRVQAVSPTSVTLKERDGSIVTVDVSPTSQILIAGQPATLDQIRRLEIATTLRVDGGAATKVSVQIPPGVAAALARGQGRGGSG